MDAVTDDDLEKIKEQILTYASDLVDLHRTETVGEDCTIVYLSDPNWCRRHFGIMFQIEKELHRLHEALVTRLNS